MKKKIAAALAATFALGVTSAFAANPFSDVEAKHWSYDSVSKLAKAGIIDGYGDGTFRGDRTMTRYEMAQIVAKAMARSDKANAEQKAMINKLSAEFSSELNNLGVRVGALEKKVGNIKITGDARVRYMHTDSKDSYTNIAPAGTTPNWVHTPTSTGKFDQRLRLYMNADVNENTSFYGRIDAMSNNKMGTTNGDATTGADLDRLRIVAAAFTTKNILGADSSVTVGRFEQYFLGTGYWAFTVSTDGVKFGFGNGQKFSGEVGFADFGASSKMGALKGVIQLPAVSWINQAYFATAKYKASKATDITAMYFKEEDSSDTNMFKVWGLGFTTKFAKDWKFTADYAKNQEANAKVVVGKNPAQYVLRLEYKGANPAVPQSWGMWLDYIKSEFGASVGSMTNSMYKSDDIKGWAIGYRYTPAKNITFDLLHMFNAKVWSADQLGTPSDYKFTRANFNFFF